MRESPLVHDSLKIHGFVYDVGSNDSFWVFLCPFAVSVMSSMHSTFQAGSQRLPELNKPLIPSQQNVRLGCRSTREA